MKNLLVEENFFHFLTENSQWKKCAWCTGSWYCDTNGKSLLSVRKRCHNNILSFDLEHTISKLSMECFVLSFVASWTTLEMVTFIKIQSYVKFLLWKFNKILDLGMGSIQSACRFKMIIIIVLWTLLFSWDNTWHNFKTHLKEKESEEREEKKSAEAEEIVAHFQKLFDVPSRDGVYTRLNDVYNRLGELMNVLHVLKDILGLRKKFFVFYLGHWCTTW